MDRVWTTEHNERFKVNPFSYGQFTVSFVVSVQFILSIFVQEIWAKSHVFEVNYIFFSPEVHIMKCVILVLSNHEDFVIDCTYLCMCMCKCFYYVLRLKFGRFKEHEFLSLKLINQKCFTVRKKKVSIYSLGCS